jgi:uncharacterized protein YjbI with pentapeptide repeats
VQDIGCEFSGCLDFLFNVEFELCILDYASFTGKKMLKTKFIKTSLKDASFANADLAGSLFGETDLSGAVFNKTDLTSANLITAFNYAIDPELNTIKKASFSVPGISGLIAKYDIKIAMIDTYSVFCFLSFRDTYC